MSPPHSFLGFWFRDVSLAQETLESSHQRSLDRLSHTGCMSCCLAIGAGFWRAWNRCVKVPVHAELVLWWQCYFQALSFNYLPKSIPFLHKFLSGGIMTASVFCNSFRNSGTMMKSTVPRTVSIPSLLTPRIYWINKMVGLRCPWKSSSDPSAAWPH